MSDPSSIRLASVLELVAMQLEVAMQHAAAQAAELSRAVARLSAVAMRMSAGSRAREEGGTAAELEHAAHQAMTAMQFHDQLAQRVAHVRDALAEVHEELRSGRDPDWTALLARLRTHYTTEDERRLFDMIFGSPPHAGSRRGDEALPGSVELF